MADVTALLAEAKWLTRLARSLVGNDDAEDIVQETFVAALRTPPDPDREARPWLRRVMVNVVRMRHRGRKRRDVREQASPVAEPVRTPEELVERARVERTLADLVLALAEPLRATVLMRYREGLSAEAIASQQGVSVATVRRRLADAIELLRNGMDEKETRNAWRAAFAPFLVRREPRAPWRTVVMAKVGSKLALVAIAALLLLVGGVTVVHHLQKPSLEHASNVATLNAAAGGEASERVTKLFAQPGLGTNSLAGRVTFGDKPFAGAKVRVTHASSRDVLAELDSGADGSFTIPALPAAALVVSASAAGKTAMPVTADLRSPTQRGQMIELRLVGCFHLRGIVSDGSGAPIAHARIAPDVAQVPFAETDALGHYDLCTHPGPEIVRFAAGGYHSVLVSQRLGGSDVLDVTLLPEAIVAGRVVDAANTPVADALVTIGGHASRNIHEAPTTARSASDGTFRLLGVAPGRSEIYAEAPGLASRRVDIVLGAGETREGVVLKVEHAPRLSGRVVDSQGKPVSGASIGLRIGSSLREGLAVAQADGSFVIERVPKGELAIVIPHFMLVSPRTVTIGDRDAKVEITADPVPSLSGVIVRGGAPVADAYIECPERMFSGEPEPTTDRTGKFTCRLTREGPFEVGAADPTGAFGTYSGSWTRGQTLAPITLELDQVGSICGTVSDADGKHLRGITIAAQNLTVDDSGRATSDDDGNYCIVSLRNEGTFEITAQIGGQQIPPISPLPQVTLVHAKATLAITLATPDQQIAGTVVDDAGAPLADVSVRVSAMGSFGNGLDVAISDSNGHFAVQRLAPGNYALLATARDGASNKLDSVAAGTKDLKVQLSAAGAIEGTLVGFHTQPSIVGLREGGGREAIYFEVDGDHFRAHGLSAGNYVVTAETNGHEADARSIAVKSGEVAALTLSSRGTVNLTGRVIDWMTKRPVTNVRCSPPYPRNGAKLGAFNVTFDYQQAVDSTGTFHFEDVTAGDILILCIGTDNVIAYRFATIAANGNAQVEVYIAYPKSGGGDVGPIKVQRQMATVSPAAAKAGLQPGDVVMALDGESVELLDGQTIRNAISNHPIGSLITLTVQRGNATLTLPITL